MDEHLGGTETEPPAAVQATESADAGRARPRILVVETRAHLSHGHFCLVFAERAAELLELGCEVEVLTSRGWALEGDPTFPPLKISRYGRVAHAADRFVGGLHHVRPRVVGAALVWIGRTVVVVLAARVHRRRTRATGVLVVDMGYGATLGVDARIACLLAGPGRWLLYQWGLPRAPRHRPGRVANWGARRAELWREERGGWLRIAVAMEGALDSWQRDLPWLAPMVIPFAAVHERQPVAAGVARAALGLPARARLALFFGMRPGKDPEVVFRAFADLPEWQLVVGGTGASQAYRAWVAESGITGGRTPVLFDGYVDETTRVLLHAAADLMLISQQIVRPGVDSANFVDALNWGLPVVCSDRCPAAQVILARGLGVVFERGDVDSLVAAVRAAPASPDASGLAAARAQLSGRRAMQRLLDALEVS
jgi:glycosyltransferase involved in cell wall biosynthesis